MEYCTIGFNIKSQRYFLFLIVGENAPFCFLKFKIVRQCFFESRDVSKLRIFFQGKHCSNIFLYFRVFIFSNGLKLPYERKPVLWRVPVCSHCIVSNGVYLYTMADLQAGRLSVLHWIYDFHCAVCF